MPVSEGFDLIEDAWEKGIYEHELAKDERRSRISSQGYVDSEEGKPTAKSVTEHFDAIVARNIADVMDAEARALSEDKEVFDAATVLDLLGERLVERIGVDDLKTRYYLFFPDVKTLGEYAAREIELSFWE